MKRVKIKRSTVNHFLNIFGTSKSPIKSILAILMLGISIGVAIEEMYGIGTWHKFHSDTDKVNVCFTPPSGCGSLIAVEIAKAQKSIYVQAYGMTLPSVINQLKAAHRRGVNVNILLDYSNLSDNSGLYESFKHAGINVAYEKMPGIAHNKVVIIDKKKVITGSFNFTVGADKRNSENVVMIEDPDIAAAYLANWHRHKH